MFPIKIRIIKGLSAYEQMHETICKPILREKAPSRIGHNNINNPEWTSNEHFSHVSIFTICDFYRQSRRTTSCNTLLPSWCRTQGPKHRNGFLIINSRQQRAYSVSGAYFEKINSFRFCLNEYSFCKMFFRFF